MTIAYVLVGIVMFGILVFVHEGGHFTAAKLCGVKVNEFALGMGPAIFQRTKGETLYSLRCIPFGGYCAMEGEDDDSGDPRAFITQPLWKRLIILVAGSLMNFILGFLIVTLLYSSAGAFVTPKIAAFTEGCPYQGEQGLMVGDRFLSIDGHRVFEYYDVSEYLDNGSETHDLILLRDGKRITLKAFHMVRIQYEGSEKKLYGFSFGYEEATLGVKLRESWNTVMQFCRWVWKGLSELFTGNVGVQDMSGPVGIVDMIAETGEQAESASDAFYSIFYIIAFIAVNLAMMNMLPIPALDGGRVFLLLVTGAIEAVTRKKLNPKYEAYIHAAGMVILLAFMAFIMFNDIWKLFKS